MDLENLKKLSCVVRNLWVVQRFLKKLHQQKAFSLIEVSVVILIIGIFIAGIIVAGNLTSKAKLSAAKTLSVSSPINGIKDSALWLETSLDNSFDPADTNSGHAVNNWYDSRSAATKVLVGKVGNGPIYSNTINDVHAVGFDASSSTNSSNSNYLQIADASFLNNTDYTIFVLEKRMASGTNYFLGSSGSGSNNSLALGYSSDTNISHSQGSNSYSSPALVTNYASSSGKARIFTFVQDSNFGKKTYINGILAAQNADTAQLSGLTSLEIGKGYTGEIGEIAIFTRALNSEDRKSVENYVSKKWTTKINRDSAVGGSSGIASCVGYTITSDGCDLTTAPCTISQTGVVTTSVSATSTPTIIACDSASHYSGNLTYTCSNGTVPCNSGYFGSGISYNCNNGNANASGSCSANCSTGSTVGINTQSITDAGGTLNCNATGYSTSDSITYTCSSGTFSVTGGTACDTCSSGYTYSGGICSVQNCTGGTVSTETISGTSYKIHTFTNTGATTFNCPSARNVDVLVVAGGGGGGGGIKYQTGVSISSGNITVTVGVGGTGGVGSSPLITTSTNGGDSSLGSYLVATGGGRGGIYNGGNGFTGGSGGGGSSQTGSGAAGMAGQGNAGGNGDSSKGGGGGGGSGGAGSAGGIGGAGASNDITGTTLYYSGGGGGGRNSVGSEGNNNVNSNGGGGRGALSCPGTGGTTANAGTANTGGGGGGAPNGCQGGGAGGGSGIVIVRYAI